MPAAPSIVDVTELTVAEFEAAGIVLMPEELHLAEGAPAWRTHSEYAAMNPRHDGVSRRYARDLARAHAAATGGLAGLELPRTFPCLGTFRHLEYVGGVRMVQCDRCGEEFGVLPPVSEGAGTSLAGVVGPAVLAATLAVQLLGGHQ